MRYRTRLLLGFGSIIAIFILLLAFSVSALFSTSSRIRAMAEREFAAERAVQDSAQIVLRVKGEVWDALFLDSSLRAGAIAALEEDARAFQRNVNRLFGLVPEQKDAFQELSLAFRSYFVFASSYLSPGEPLSLGGAPDAVRKFRANQDELMSLIRKTSGVVEREFEASLLGLNAFFRDIALVSLLGAALAVIAAGIAALGLSRRLTRPIDELADAAASVARGDFGVRVAVAERAGEAAMLASVFNSMLDEIGRYHEGLEAEVRVRTDELEEAQGRLVSSEKRAAIARIVAGIAHELNTPLAAISSSNRASRESLGELLLAVPALYEGASAEERDFYRSCVEGARSRLGAFDTREDRSRRRAIAARLAAAGKGEPERWAETLAGMGFSDLPPEAAAMLGTERGERLLDIAAKAAGIAVAASVAELAASKAASVVDTLRSYADQDLPPNITAVELRSQIEGALSLLLAGGRRAPRVTWAGVSSAWVMGDRDELGLVWANILANALHAMDYAGELEVELRDDGSKVRVTIADDGPGILEEHRERVFEPFFTTKPLGEGKGLGLDISRRIVLRHGGEIGFESEPGRTAFTVTLDSARVSIPASASRR